MTFQLLYRKIRAELENAGNPAPAAEASLIIENVCGLDRSGFVIHGREECPNEYESEAFDICRQRTSGRPLQYIFGIWPFYGANFKVGEGVLIPRDDTEVLVNACMPFLALHKRARVLDLCSGSGIIAITLMRKFPECNTVAIEKSDTAFGYLTENIRLNNVNVTPLKADVFTCHESFEDEYFDLIVSNPPYVSASQMRTLQPEVKKEPAEALDGGADGLDFYRCITHDWTPKLRSGGLMAFEIGEGQENSVAELMTGNGLAGIASFSDIMNTPRALTGYKR